MIDAVVAMIGHGDHGRGRHAGRRARRRVRAAHCCRASGCSSSGSPRSRCCLPLLSVLLSGWVAFHMGDDVKILAVSAASAAVAVVAGLVLARSISDSVDRVRDASAQLAARRPRRSRAPEGGPVRGRRARRPRSTRWREASSGCSTRAASSSRGRATTSARRSRTCRRCSRRSRTASSSRTTTLPVLREQVRVLSHLVDDLFELARIDAGALTLELRETPARAGRRSAACAGSRPTRGSAGSASPPTWTPRPARAARPTRSSGSSSTCSRTRCATRPPTAPSRSASARDADEVLVSVEDTGAGLDDGGAHAHVRAVLARRPGAHRSRGGARAWRSHAVSSRRTADASGPRTDPAAAPGSASRCRRPARPSAGWHGTRRSRRHRRPRRERSGVPIRSAGTPGSRAVHGRCAPSAASLPGAAVTTSTAGGRIAVVARARRVARAGRISPVERAPCRSPSSGDGGSDNSHDIASGGRREATASRGSTFHRSRRPDTLPGWRTRHRRGARPAHEPPAGAETARTWSGPDGPIAYTASAGWLVLYKKEKPAAEIFSVSYVATTPVTGGPSPSSSTAAPAPRRRTCTWERSGRPGSTFPPTARSRGCRRGSSTNESSWLAFTDLVFVDPVGTGFSRVIESDKAEAGKEQQPTPTTGRPEGVLRAQARPRVAVRVHEPLALEPRTLGLAGRDRRRELRRLPGRPARAEPPGERRGRPQRRDPDLPGARDHLAQPDRLRRRRLDRHAADDGRDRRAPRSLARLRRRAPTLDEVLRGGRGVRDRASTRRSSPGARRCRPSERERVLARMADLVGLPARSRRRGRRAGHDPDVRARAPPRPAEGARAVRRHGHGHRSVPRPRPVRRARPDPATARQPRTRPRSTGCCARRSASRPTASTRCSASTSSRRGRSTPSSTPSHRRPGRRTTSATGCRSTRT